MRILLVEFTSSVSGAERSMLELIEGLRSKHDVTLACPCGDLADRATALGLRVFPIPASQLTFRHHLHHTPRGLAAMARAALQLRAIVKTARPDVVHANSIRGGLLAIPAARRVAPVVVHCRDTLPVGVAGTIVRCAVLAGADHVAAISRHVALSLGGAGWVRRRITVVDNAVDLVRFDPTSSSALAGRSELGQEGDLVLSVIAQITPWKGQDLAIRVLGELRSRGVDAVLLLVGEAKFLGAATRYDNRAFERDLHALVDRLGLGGYVRFLGERSDAERVLAASDVLLVPSTEEPFGRTIIEAMAMGVPVVSTSVGGPPEILRGGIGGRLVVGRAVTDWADAVQEIAYWPQDRRVAARDVAAVRFSRQHHTATMLEVYATASEWRQRQRHRALFR